MNIIDCNEIGWNDKHALQTKKLLFIYVYRIVVCVSVIKLVQLMLELDIT